MRAATVILVASLSGSLACLSACAPAAPPGSAPPSVSVPILAPGEGEAPSAATAEPAGAEAECAPGSLCGEVLFTGTPPEMHVPPDRGRANVCKSFAIAHNAVRVNDGRLADVAVHVVSGLSPTEGEPPPPALHVRRKDCVHLPRVAAAMVGQTLFVHNGDSTLHNVHGYDASRAGWFNRAQPKGADPIKNTFDEPGIYSIHDDVHPWEHGFVVVSPHRFFAVTGERGEFVIKGLPPGTYGVEAWHSIYGKKSLSVAVKRGRGVTARFTYDGSEPLATDNSVAEQELKSFQ